MTCPHRPSGRHRWKSSPKLPADRRECSCGALALVDAQGCTKAIAELEISGASITVRSIGR